jgi:hypothetical protein
VPHGVYVVDVDLDLGTDDDVTAVVDAQAANLPPA